MHTNQSLPSQEDHKYVSRAAEQPRQFNPETEMIRNANITIKGMKKSSNAIAFFAKTPDKAEVKLVFCKPTTYQTDNVYEPYELQVV